MRYVRCHECGSTEVPTLATCPSCGIKTPIQIRTRWWLLAAVAVLGAVLGVAAGRRLFEAGQDDASLRARLVRLEADFQVQRDRAEQLRRENARLARENAALLAPPAGGRRMPPPESPRVEPTEPVVAVAAPAAAGDDRLRLAHVRWAAAFASAARLWQPPYPPMSALRDMDRDLAGLDVRTRELASAFTAIADGARQAEVLRRFEGQLRALRDALDPGRQVRVVVGAQTDWRESAVEVRTGDLVYLEAVGSWSMALMVPTDDNGEALVAPVEPLVLTAPIGAVLWRVRGVGRTEALLPGGPSGAARVDAAGPLEFRINERYLDDNAGSVRVTVVVLPKSVTDALQATGSELIGR